MTFRCASPQASRTRTISSCTRASSPARNASREITMSISSAPAATASSVARSLMSSGTWPDGKPVATAAVFTPVPASAVLATPASAGYTQTAAHDGISGMSGAGQTALEQRWRTLPGVSAPSSVVRSSIDTARRMPCCLAVVLIERLPSVAARSSMPTRSTWGRRRITPPSMTRLVLLLLGLRDLDADLLGRPLALERRDPLDRDRELVAGVQRRHRELRLRHGELHPPPVLGLQPDLVARRDRVLRPSHGC